jgi:CRISPR-associated protein (TIGR03986 family)
MPRHVNPSTLERTARAPYNFVPLPERVLEVGDGSEVNGARIKPWEMHGQFVPGTYSGWIDLEIETLTPLYIRGAAMRRGGGTWDTRDARLRPEPYTTPDGRPAIPGSSLRGMVRTLVEILSFSKIQPMSEAKPFFRTVDDSRIGKVYRKRMAGGGRGVCAGILRLRGGQATIEPREKLRVARRLLESRGLRFEPRNPSWTPPWSHQHQRCWVKFREGASEVGDIEIEQQSGGGWKKGILVLTGNAPGKRREFVLVEPQDGPAEPVRVPDAIWRRFHDEDQITLWQERAYPRNEPRDADRKADGHLRDGEPVFFLTDDGEKDHDNPDGLLFFGRAGMFRLPYDLGPADLVPEPLRTAGLDVAEALFGKVDSESAVKGRVFFEDGVAAKGGSDWFEDELVPRILSSPKPTTFQHYLTQDGTRDKDQLTTYIDGDHTTIRGHKLYWHRWGEGGLSEVRESDNQDGPLRDLNEPNPEHKQHTIIRPVRAGVIFSGRIRFQNLTDLELGALLSALQLPEGCCHKLGMGKPLGLGSVRIEPTFVVVDRSKRYRSWSESGVENADRARFREVFEKAIIEHARVSGEALLPGAIGLRQVARLDALFRLLQWDARPRLERTAYMSLKDFKQRPVLPTPHHVAGTSEPPWRRDPPRPAPTAEDRGRRGDGRPPRARAEGTPGATPGRPGASAVPGPPRAGDRVEAVLLEDRTSKGGWKAWHQPSGLSGHIINSVDVPASARPGDRVDLVVASVGTREIAFRFPPAMDPGQAKKKNRK